ncbi:MAG: PD40 domain-containing protein [Planctomycetes bacterium]|nr:PD40 domain-containing protein [Planctomycetota bacterium]
MRYAGVLVLLLLAGCASDRREVAFSPVGYDLGVSPARGAAVNGPVVLLTDHDRARDCHPVFAAGWLYFASDRDGDGFNIYRKRLDARAAERLTAMEGDEYWPRVTVDGHWLAFGGNARGHWDIYLVDLTAVGPPQLLTPADRQDCVQPAWSPDGRNVVYSGYSPTLDGWTIRGITFVDPAPPPEEPVPSAMPDRVTPVSTGVRRPAIRAGNNASPQIETVGYRPKPVEANNAPPPLRAISSHWNLLAAGNVPLRGLHADYAADGSRLAYQEYRRDDSSWYLVKVYDFSSGLTTTLSPPRGYGAIQPRFAPDGTLVFLTSAKAGARPETGDGFALVDLSGNVLRDIRNPLGRGEVSDPAIAVVDGKAQLIFSWADGDGESLCWLTLPGP